MDHVLWMLENHPEWEGFILNLSTPGFGDEAGTEDFVRAAWLRQIRSDQKSGIVLHHAAVFFERQNPDFAAELMHRAIRLEPNVPFYVEALGALYARSQLGAGKNWNSRAAQDRYFNLLLTG
jgi:hypothetical protein